MEQQRSARNRPEWKVQFLDNLARSGYVKARERWEQLGKAGLGDVAEELLYTVYWSTTDEGKRASDGIRKKIGHAASNVKKASYAAGKAEVAARSNRPRTPMFASRLEQSIETAAQTSWAFQNPEVKNLAGASAAYTEVGDIPLDEAPDFDTLIWPHSIL